MVAGFQEENVAPVRSQGCQLLLVPGCRSDQRAQCPADGCFVELRIQSIAPPPPARVSSWHMALPFRLVFQSLCGTCYDAPPASAACSAVLVAVGWAPSGQLGSSAPKPPPAALASSLCMTQAYSCNRGKHFRLCSRADFWKCTLHHGHGLVMLAFKTVAESAIPRAIAC